MIKFQLQNSPLAFALKTEKYFGFCQFFQKIFLFSSIFLFFLAFFIFFTHFGSEKFLAKILGFLLLSFLLFLATSLQIFFYQNFLKNPKTKVLLLKVCLNPKNFNLADFLTFDLFKTIWRLCWWARFNKKFPLNSNQLFYFILNEKKAKIIFLRAGFNLENIKKELAFLLANPLESSFDVENPLYSQEFQKVLLEALNFAAKKNKERIDFGDIVYGLAKVDLYFKKILIENEMKIEDIEKIIEFEENLEKEKGKKFWQEDFLRLIPPIGRGFSSAYTITLDQYSFDWSIESLRMKGELINHERELEQIERILSRTQLNNVLLVGRPGSGRREIVKAFAKKSYFGLLGENLNYQRFIALNLPSLIAQIESLERAELVLEKIFREVRDSGNVILIIEDFHKYVEPKPRPGILNISGLLSSFLEKASFRIIAITDYLGLHKYIEQNPSLLNFFSKVEVRELNEKETLKVLENWLPFFERKYKKFIPFPTLKSVVSLASKYLPDTAFPQKAIDLLDEVIVESLQEKPQDFVVLPEDVEKVVTEKTQIPVGKIKEKERETLLNLEALIHKRIVNQKEAVSDLAEALRRARTGVTVREGPMGAFLFLGPTGVGKTETAKALAEIYFGSEKRIIRLDMSEFQQIGDIPRLIGSPGQEGLLTTKVREDPFSLVLLDEIEKAHKNILNLFLQVLDEGYLTDGLGRKVSFKNTIIIGTSNAGSDLIWKTRDIKKEELLLYLIDKEIFRPEFLNRFDGVIMYKPLSKSDLLDIAELMLEKLKAKLKEKEIILSFSPKVKEKIVDLGYSPSFGAREMRRVIQEKIENLLALAILENKIKKGDWVKIVLNEKEEFELKINPS